ncbi:MAG: phosphatidylserine decarboxylase, partial [Arenicellales bacterium]
MNPAGVATPLIAREGWGRIGLALSIAIFVHWQVGFWWALPFWVITALIVQFFRDPPRRIPAGAGLVVSPAHGKVVSVQLAEDPITGQSAMRISIFMNI